MPVGKVRVQHLVKTRWVLRDVSFSLPAGGTLAIVGATGSGKSALMDLIPRFFDPQEGVILLDGIPIRELSLDTLRHEIGYVPQESLLFSETVGANIAYGVIERHAPIAGTGEHLAQGVAAVVTPQTTGTPPRCPKNPPPSSSPRRPARR